MMLGGAVLVRSVLIAASLWPCCAHRSLAAVAAAILSRHRLPALGEKDENGFLRW